MDVVKYFYMECFIVNIFIEIKQIYFNVDFFGMLYGGLFFDIYYVIYCFVVKCDMNGINFQFWQNFGCFVQFDIGCGKVNGLFQFIVVNYEVV